VVLIQAYRKAGPPASDCVAVVPGDCERLAGGLCWGLGSWLLLDPSRAEFQFIVFLTCAAIAAGAITAFGTLLPAYYCNLLAIMVRPPSGPRCRATSCT